jgi:hypothetical protein
MADAVKPAADLRFDTVDALLDWLLHHPKDVLGAITARYRARDARGAERISAAAVALYPHNDDVWFQHGMAAIHLGDWAKAAERFAAMRERFAEYAPAYSFGGMTLRNCGRAEEAEALLRRGHRVSTRLARAGGVRAVRHRARRDRRSDRALRADRDGLPGTAGGALDAERRAHAGGPARRGRGGDRRRNATPH